MYINAANVKEFVDLTGDLHEIYGKMEMLIELSQFIPQWKAEEIKKKLDYEQTKITTLLDYLRDKKEENTND